MPENVQEAASPSAVMLLLTVPVPKLTADGLRVWGRRDILCHSITEVPCEGEASWPRDPEGLVCLFP